MTDKFTKAQGGLTGPSLPLVNTFIEGRTVFADVMRADRAWLVRSAKALSKYTDLVDSLARQQRELLEGASDEARVKLREWELPEALNVRADSYIKTLGVILSCHLHH